MFIHTLTFLNISKSSPTKSYLAYLISNLCCIIQSSCSHFSLKMQHMNLASLLLCLCTSPCPLLTLSFYYLGFRADIHLKCAILVLSFFPFPLDRVPRSGTWPYWLNYKLLLISPGLGRVQPMLGADVPVCVIWWVLSLTAFCLYVFDCLWGLSAQSYWECVYVLRVCILFNLTT